MKGAPGPASSSPPTADDGIIRFGSFEVDLRAGELRRNGLKLKLAGQPFDVLVALLEKPGQVVTREELHDKLWSQDTFVDFEQGLNKAINRVRDALGDDADNPRFIETLPRRGYRFLGPLTQRLPEVPATAVSREASAPNRNSSAQGGIRAVSAGAKILRRTIVPAALSLTAVAVIAWLYFVIPHQPSELHPTILRFVQLTRDGQLKSGPMATDGVRIYFTETLPGQLRTLAQVSTTGGDVVKLPTPLRRPRVLDLSDDGTELLVGNQEQTGAGNQVDSSGDSLWIQPVAGGSPRRVGSGFINDAAWGRHGAMVVYGDAEGVYLMNKDATDARRVVSRLDSPFSFSFSPDGQLLRFSFRDGSVGSSSIMETSAGGNNMRKLFPGCCGKWTPDGRYFVFQSEHEGRTDLWVVPETGGFLSKTSGSRPIRLTAGPLEFETPIASKDGKEIFAIGNLRTAELVRYDSHSREFVPYLPGISAEGLSFSKDGEWVAYTSYPDGALWRSRIDGSEGLQLTFPPMRVLLPRWSPNGREIVFCARFPGRPWNIYLLPSDGGTAKQLISDAEDRVDPNWSPDGNSLVFGSFDLPHNPIWILDLRTTRVSTLPGSVGLFSPRWSPDGRYICAITTERPFRLMLFDFTTRQWTQLTASDIGFPSWSHDGRYIYFGRNIGHNRSASVGRIQLSDRKVETIVDLKNLGRSATGSFGTQWVGFTPDESPILARDISTHEIYALDVQWP